MTTNADTVLTFWFGESPASTQEQLLQKIQRWFQGGAELDRQIAERFGGAVELAIAGGFAEWEGDPRSCLALIVVLDQFTRSIYRGDPKAFLGDARAQQLVLRALDAGWLPLLAYEERQFLLMPLLHAEHVPLQERFLELIERHVAEAPPPLRATYAMAVEQSRKYLDVITRFGRFPHRNAVLGRESSAEEIVFLKAWEARRRPSPPG
jgi:uncharacterized protein (DUF924 family)